MITEKKKLESNLWKMLLHSILIRRAFYPILSVFLLSLPNTTAKMIGLSTGIAQIISFFAETPSGYFADIFGHKKTIILSRIFMIISTLCYLFANSFFSYLFGLIFTTLGFAFSSGAHSAFVHDTLVALKRDKEFTKVSSKMSGNASLISFFMIVSLPFFTTFSIRFPFIFYLVFDIIGLIITLLLYSPKREISQEHKKESIASLLKKLSKTNFFSLTIFFGIINGVMFGLSSYRAVYLESLGFPLILLGVLGVSRLVWFLLGNVMHKITKNIAFEHFLFFEIIFFTISYTLIAILNNGFAVITVLVLSNGYFWGRKKYVENYYLDHFLLNKKFKATLLSLKVQIGNVFVAIVGFTSAYVMQKSYKFGFITFAIALPILLTASYFWFKKQ